MNLSRDILPVSVTLIVNQIRSVLVRCPLHDSRLAFLTLQAQGSLEGSEGFVILSGFIGILLPLTKAAQSGWLGAAQSGSFNSGKYLDLDEVDMD